MKILSLALLSVATLGRAVHAQECGASYFAKPGAVIELTEYNADNQFNGKQVYTVSNATSSGTGVQATLASVKTDKNGAVTEQKTQHYTCSAQGVQWGQGATDAHTKTEAVVNYPATMTAGQDLKTQLEYSMTGKTPEGKNAQVNVKVKNRKVVGTEKVTLKVGTWTCTKITYDVNFRLKIGFVGLPLDFTVTEWYAPEVGVVKSQSIMKGKLLSRTEITALRK